MTPVYTKKVKIFSADTDRFDRLKLSRLLGCLQEAAGDHSALLGAGRQTLAEKNLFWAITRHRVQITRLPRAGEKITLETWPMPTTRTAYPRSTVALDEDGQVLFRAVSLWVLMDTDRRAMILPGKSGVLVEGLLRGDELTVPAGLLPGKLAKQDCRQVRFTDLDCNGHMNNCRYLDWAADVLPSGFHSGHPVRDISVRYHSEAREGEVIHLGWELEENNCLTLEGLREEPENSSGHSRIFSVQMQF